MYRAAGAVLEPRSTAPRTAPTHQWTFKFRSNALCLNFVASMAGPRSRPHGVERWTSPALLEEWFHRSGLPILSTSLNSGDVADARELREAIFRLATLEQRGAPASACDIDLVNHWSRRQPYVPILDAGARHQRLPEVLEFAELMALVAADAIDLFTGEFNHRIKECASEKCPILFVDRSRAGNRRWCSERPCGFQASSRAYRLRRSESDDEAT